MIVGFGRARIVPPPRFDPQGFAARDRAVADVDPELSVTVCVIRGSPDTVAIASADALAHTPAAAAAIRARIADVVGCHVDAVLLSATHTHASVWPGAEAKVSGESHDAWLPGEREFLDVLPATYAEAAVAADRAGTECRVSWGVGNAPGWSVNRRQRTPDGGTVIGVNPDGYVDDSVVGLRFDDRDGGAVGLIVGYACHPVVLGPRVARASTDFVGPLRRAVEDMRGGMCLFLQGASGNVMPREALFDEPGPEVTLGRRIALEALRAVADRDPWPRSPRPLSVGSWTPTVVYRRVTDEPLPEQVVAVAARVLEVPLSRPPSLDEARMEFAQRTRERQAALEQGAPGSVTNGIDNQLRWLAATIRAVEAGAAPTAVEVELWAARIGDGVIVGVSAELFGEIGDAIRAASPSITLVAGCCNGVLGYVPTAAEYPFGGFEVLAAHRVYGLPAAVAPEAARMITASARELLASLGATPSPG